MSPTLFGEKARWTVAAGGAAAVVASLLFLFRFPQSTLPLPAASAAVTFKPVTIAKAAAADAVLKEETEMRDLRPLFLPTEHNASLPEPHREPGRTFLDDESLKLGFGEAELTLNRDLSPPEISTSKLASNSTSTGLTLLAETVGLGSIGFGRGEVPIEPLPPRAGYVEVVETGTGSRVLGELLPPAARPPGEKPWEPIEFLAAIDAAGLSAPLIVTSSSRVEEVDTHFRNYLSQTFRVGERLPPGFYRIIVGP